MELRFLVPRDDHRLHQRMQLVRRRARHGFVRERSHQILNMGPVERGQIRWKLDRRRDERVAFCL
ncbi:hypothetical protein DU478_00630 [Thalassococcus profundi]|uniref:Uncharacterized protein n=1 Tax=Thalassococcus profundi TaxID=2282382 RepID=A0A369TS69_9RHOB|nr:hypothetical protein DU478_00630 [Thalassococcus profundi]